VRQVWESQKALATPPVGCLNEKCCSNALYYAKSKLDYLAFFSFLYAVLGIINQALLASLISFLQLFTLKRVHHGFGEFLLLISLFVIAGATIFGSWFSTPQGPSFMPYLRIEGTDWQFGKDPTYIPSSLLDFDGYFDIFDIRINEDSSAC